MPIALFFDKKKDFPFDIDFLRNKADTGLVLRNCTNAIKILIHGSLVPFADGPTLLGSQVRLATA